MKYNLLYQRRNSVHLYITKHEERDDACDDASGGAKSP